MKIKKISTKTPDNSKVLNQQSSSTTDTYSCNYVNNLIDIVYPVGSLYWTSQNVNPATLFGGTWQQITDTFILAAGSTYLNGATGGEFTHTLTVEEMPSHTHTFTGTTHSHGLNNHTHTYAKPNSPTGASTGNTGSTTLTIDQIPEHIHTARGWADVTDGSGNYRVLGAQGSSDTYSVRGTGGGQGHTHTLNNHTHTVGTTSTNTGTASGNTADATQGGTNSNTGGGQAFNITPKYLVRYCWERIA